MLVAPRFLVLGLLLGSWVGRPVRAQVLDPAFVPTVAYGRQLVPGTVRALHQQADGRILVASDFLLFNN